MRVTLLSYTKDAERLCSSAARSCYSSKGAEELMERWNEEKMEGWLGTPLSGGHHSVLEHASYTFSIEGVSRAMTHQLVRHRIASYSQQSQRYVSMDHSHYILPPSVAEDKEAAEKFKKMMDSVWECYEYLVSRNVPAEDARYVLPNSCSTNITVTMNARELLHFLELRTCRRAQWEIREVAEEMLKLVREVSPFIFNNAGPSCISQGACKEGKMSCKNPRLDLKKQLSSE